MVYDLIRTLRDRGISVVLISHNMVDVFAIADRITVLRLGANAGVFDAAVARPSDVVAAITGSDAIVGGDAVSAPSVAAPARGVPAPPRPRHATAAR